jgi:ubiquinone/menaquinone biosynthesis C-methylase UbiE
VLVLDELARAGKFCHLYYSEELTLKRTNITNEFRDYLLVYLLDKVRKRLLEMIEFPILGKTIVDVGCGRGKITENLSIMTSSIISLDVNKDLLLKAKNASRNADFICADACHLPLIENSADIAIVSSVFEFISDVETAIKQVKNILRNGSTLVVGYPIDSKILRTLITLIDRDSARIWNPHSLMTDEQFRKGFMTHKHTHKTIRYFLSNNFAFLQKEKIPSKHLPDPLSVYECVRLVKIAE